MLSVDKTWRGVALGLLLTAGIAFAIKKAPIIVDEPPTQPFSVGFSTEVNVPHPTAFTVMGTDSCVNEYGLWTQIQNVAYAKWNSINFVFRGWEADGSGFIASVYSTDDGGNWTTHRRLNEEAGVMDAGGRYPNGMWSTKGAVATFPELAPGPAWGYMAAVTVVEPSGSYGTNSSDLATHKNNSVLLSDGKVACVGAEANNSNLYVAVYDPVTGAYSYTPTLVGGSNFSLGGIDVSGDTVYIFGFDNNGSSLAYYTAVYDGSTLTVSGPTAMPAVPAIDLGGGYILDTIMWIDGAVVNGAPVMVCDLISSVDSVSESKAIMFLTATTVDTVVLLTSANGEYMYYPQLSYEPTTNYVHIAWERMVKWMGSPTLGWGVYDIFTVSSTDGGSTWGTPVNHTNDTTSSEQLVHVARHAFNGKLWAIYGYSPTDLFDLYWDVQSVGGTHLMYVDYGYLDVPTGVSETPAPVVTKVQPSFNLAGRTLDVAYTLPNVSALNVSVYDAAGRQVTSETRRLSGTGNLSVDLSALASGAYVAKVSAGDQNASLTLSIVR